MRKRETGGRIEGEPLDNPTTARKTNHTRKVVRAVAQQTGFGGRGVIPLTYTETGKPTSQFLEGGGPATERSSPPTYPPLHSRYVPF
jgi:hypothetical protein